MSKIIKSRIFTFVLGAVIFSGITGVAAYSMFAKDIKYTPSDTTWKKSNGEDINNVSDAIDELYSKANIAKKYDSVTYNLISDSQSTYGETAALELPSNNLYKYFKITSLTKDTSTNISSCSLSSWSSAQQKSVSLNVNQQYDIRSTTDGYKYGSVELHAKSTSNGAWGRCRIIIQFYN